eukprot:SAG11_NODE_102_length_16709_cov_31.066093_21_plen_99_part_00
MHVVIATGRGTASALRVADGVLGVGSALLCNNGAVVLSSVPPRPGVPSPERTALMGGRRILHKTFYPPQFVQELAAHCEKQVRTIAAAAHVLKGNLVA